MKEHSRQGAIGRRDAIVLDVYRCLAQVHSPLISSVIEQTRLYYNMYYKIRNRTDIYSE